MSHQCEAVAKILPSRVGALFMDMGTGKTRTAIELVKIRSKKISKVVWFCPVSLKETIKYEILKHTTCSEQDIYMFDAKTKSNNVPDAMWYIVGIESISGSNREACAAYNLIDDDSFVIVDESSYIKGHKAKRTERITFYARNCRYRLILTGTPISQGYEDLYSQMRFLSPKILGYNSFYSFAANHLEYHPKFRGLIVKAHNTAYLAAKIKPYTYQVTKDECLNLPPKLFDSRYFSMTPEQRRAYEQAKDEILFECEPEDFDSIVIFRLFTTLQSIICGFWNRKGKLLTFPHKRVETCMDILHAIPDDEKVVIWTKYRMSVQEIKDEIQRLYGKYSVAEFHGGNLKNRDCELDRFKSDKQTRFLIANQSCGGHGLTITEAKYAIFYSDGFKYSERLQAEDRCHRIGQGYPVTYISIRCLNSIDDRIQTALMKKGDTLSMFRDEVDKIKKTNKDKLRELVMSL